MFVLPTSHKGYNNSIFFFFYFVADEFSLVTDKPDLHKKTHLQKNSVETKMARFLFLTFVLAIPILIKCLI